MVSKYRIGPMSELARSMAFTPSDARWTQTTAAEQLLHEIDPARSYPLDFVIYRITNYRPAARAESELLTGSSVQHDLGLLIEQVSASLAMRVVDLAEPVLSIGDVCERFDVTSKTIQRWRRKGLASRRFVFADGRLKVGFLLGSVERFIARQQQSDEIGCNNGRVNGEQLQEILRRARRLASAGCWPAEIARRIGKRTGRSPLMVLHTIRKHDQEHSEEAIFASAMAAPNEAERGRILRGYRRGISLRRMGRKLGRRRVLIGRILLEQRAAKLSSRRVRFIDDPLYHGDAAEQAITAIVGQNEIVESPSVEERRLPRDLPPYLRELYRVPLLPASKERALFLKFNFHKYQFATARRELDPQFATRRQLDHLESLLAAATDTKNEILRANLRLVVSVARKHVRPGLSLMELVSEGNITLMRAVEGFDVHKGNRFSTYATLALMKGFARSAAAMLSERPSGERVELGELADRRVEQCERRRAELDQLWALLTRLPDNERRALLDHYDVDPLALGNRTLGAEGAPERNTLSSACSRQLRQRAMARLRQVVHDE